jgi:hypothetical protein
MKRARRECRGTRRDALEYGVWLGGGVDSRAFFPISCAIIRVRDSGDAGADRDPLRPQHDVVNGGNAREWSGSRARALDRRQRKTTVARKTLANGRKLDVHDHPPSWLAIERQRSAFSHTTYNVYFA